MRRVVSLFLPTWPTDRLRRKPDAPPPDRPLVTATRDGPRRVLAAVDGAARALGLYPGMAVAHARAMVRGLVVAEADPDGDAAGLARLSGWCLRYTPLSAPDPPDGVWLDVTGCAHLHGDEGALVATLVARLRAGGVAARGAVADTPGAAHAVARFGDTGATVVPPGAGAKALAGLPVAALRLPPGTAATLRRLGFERIGQLYDVPRGPLALRFGSGLVGSLDQALGRRAEPLRYALPPATPRRELSFAEPIADPEDLRRVIGVLADGLCRELERAGLGARRLDLLFHRVDRRVEAVRVGTAQPSRDPGHLTRLLAGRLETVDPGFGIEAAVLAASLSERLPPRQTGPALAGAGPDQEPDVAALVDALANRLGPERLFRAAPVESDLPERSVRRLPPLAAPAGLSWPASLPRPSRLLDPPEPVAATALLPDHPPSLFVWRGARHRVRRADGPERVFGEWWRAPAELGAVRDYYRVEAEDGARFWLFRSGPTGSDSRWFLHGLFG